MQKQILLILKILFILSSVSEFKENNNYKITKDVVRSDVEKNMSIYFIHLITL